MTELNPYFFLLEQLYKKAPVINKTSSDRIVIFSDLHMGDGRSYDDFIQNADLFYTALKQYYLPQGYTLILNGDVEEALKFNVAKIEEHWEKIYTLFSLFNEKGRLYKITGNHDPKIFFLKHKKYNFTLHDALRLTIDGKEFFIYHGHQSSYYYDAFSDIMIFFLRYIANPLRIRNYSLSYHSKKKSHIEKMAYLFAKRKKIIAIIGHTHRPLFESLSKMDTMKFSLEYYLRKYQNAESSEKEIIGEKIKDCSIKIKDHIKYGRKDHTISSLYSDTIILPCVFNSGTVVGKRGMTSIEILDGTISLVHWFDKSIKKKYLDKSSIYYSQIAGTGISRYILKHDTLDYLFSKIQLLG